MLWGAAAVLIVGALWLLVTALLVRGEMAAIRKELPALRANLSAGRITEAQSESAQLAAHARRAHALASGPAWATAAQLPWLGRPAQMTRQLLGQADALGNDVLPGVLRLAGELHSSTLRDGSQLNLDQLTAAAPALQQAASRAAAAAIAVTKIDRHSWLSPLDSSRAQFQTDLTKISSELGNAAAAIQVAPAMLGQSGMRRYFIGFENNAEARGLGGLPGQFAILTADHGKLSFTNFGSDDDLAGARAPIDLGTDYDALYAQDDPTGKYQNSDISPNFPDAAQIWAGMWQQKTGQHIDAAIGVDPNALGYLLSATGPADVPGGVTLHGADVVNLVENLVYQRYPDTASRKTYLNGVARAIADKLLSGGDVSKLLNAAGRAATERRLVVWSAEPTEQAMLHRVGYAGVLGGQVGPFTGFVVNNIAGTKLDYYLDRSVTYTRSSCAAGGTSTASMTLRNTAPASGLPAYVTGRSDTSAAQSKPGDNRLLVSYYGSAGSTVHSATLDGKDVPVSVLKENGLTVVVVDIELPVGATHTVQVTLNEPAATAPAHVLKQPLARPLKLSSSGATCG
jgi:hypothetical protein